MIGYTVVNQKGQVTVPANIRRFIGLEPKEKVMVSLADNLIMIKLIPDIYSLKGSIKPRKKPEDFKKMREAFKEYLGARKT